MTSIRIFISSVQREFAEERQHLREFLRGDPLLRRYFRVFLFEDVPASSRRPDEVYLHEVEQCDVYVGLFGSEYGTEDSEGISPTEREFYRASNLDKHRLIFVKGGGEVERHPKMGALIRKAQSGLVRKRFVTRAELVAGLYAGLVHYLEVKELLRFGPFDAAPCLGATLDDLNVPEMYRFIRRARIARQFSLDEETPPADLLVHLNLLNMQRLTNAAVLLFGRDPQRFLMSSEVKCARFHGTDVSKPVPSYQVFKGTVFQLVDQAVDFVMGKLDRAVGTRANSVQAPTAYEIPIEVVRESIVNAVAHRDYADNSSTQVMLYSDRLEVMNSGRLPPLLSVEKLRTAHQSLPTNPLIAQAMYLLGYIEKLGTGTLDMIRRCANAGLAEPEFEASEGFLTRIWRPDGDYWRNVAGISTQEIEDATRTTTQETAGTTQETASTTQEIAGTTQETTGTTQETAGTTQETAGTTQEKVGIDENDASTTHPQSTRERILSLLAAEPTMTRARLASRLEISPEGVKYHLDKLRHERRIRHVGPTKKGRWEVLKTDQKPPPSQ